MKMEIIALLENPINAAIYGEDDSFQLAELVEKIKVSGYIKPLIINRSYMIISGHRRYRAAKALGMTEIEVEMINKDENQELEILLAENAFREKTTLQKVREAEYYRIVEEMKAKERQLSGTTLSASVHGGRTNEIVGEKIGMSARSYHDARKVVEKIAEEENHEIMEFLEATVNTSVNAATKLVEKPTEFIQEVITRTSGDTKNVSMIVRELENTNHSQESHLPYGSSFQVIYLDLTVPFDNDPSKLSLGNIADNDSILFLWTLPEDLEIALSMIRKWGFKFRSCMLWNTDFFNEVGTHGQILLISSKGKIKIIAESKGKCSGIEKPASIRSLIETNYFGDKLEILPDGWQIWGS